MAALAFSIGGVPVVTSVPVGISAPASAVYQVWAEWNASYVVCANSAAVCSIASYGSESIWQQWVVQASDAATSSVWPTWNCAWVPTAVTSVPYLHPTDAEVAAAVARGAESKARRELATAKATALLVDNLDVAQRRQFEAAQTFEVLSKDGKRTYQVRYGRAGNVYLMRDGKAVSKFCIHPTDSNIPTEDVMLCQKLMLEGAEKEFLRIANETRLVA